jgi:hypothetical protein
MKTDEIKIEPIAGEFNTEASLMWQLEKLTTNKLAKKWFKEYLQYHKGIDQSVKYSIGYFADELHRNNLYKWLK